jgi:hypothetical protein
LRRATRTIPVVFAVVPDPVGAGFVDSLARPGGNITGFTGYEYGIGAKWVELLKQIAPNVTRGGIIRDPAITAGIGLWGAIQSASPSVGVEVSPINLDDRSGNWAVSNSSLIEARIERSDISTAPAPDYDLEVTEGAAATCPASQPSIARLRVTPQW